MKRQVSPSMEDYLETIHLLKRNSGNVRVRDIARALSISMPSVTGALKNLEKKGFVNHPRYDSVGLTESGSRIAREVYRRHRVIKTFLSKVLGLNTELAEKDACRIEHWVSAETADRLTEFLKAEYNIRTEQEQREIPDGDETDTGSGGPVHPG